MGHSQKTDQVQPHGTRIELKDLIRLQMYAGLLHLSYKDRIRSMQAGGYLSPFRGRGMEFDEVRSYQAGDDVRLIDWRVTARTGEPHTKLFREERERPVFFLVDLGPTMQFGTRNAFKSVVASYAAGLLAWAAMGNGDRVGGITSVGDKHIELKPAGGKRGVLRLFQMMVQSNDNIPDQEGMFEGAFLRLCRLTRPGSLIYLISDFHRLDQVQDYMPQLCRHNDVVMLYVYDHMEKRPPPPGLYPVTNGKQRFLWNTHGANKFEKNFLQRFDNMKSLCRRHRIHLIPLSTDREILHPIRVGLHQSRRQALYSGEIQDDRGPLSSTA